MASITTRKSGSRFIEFVLNDSRKMLSIGRVSKRTAETIKGWVERLVEAAYSGTAPDAETCRWLGEIDDRLHTKLANAGLTAPRQQQVPKLVAALGPFIDDYLAGRTDIKHWTKENCKQARRNLVTYFGENRDIATITPGDADEWRFVAATHKASQAWRTDAARIGSKHGAPSQRPSQAVFQSRKEKAPNRRKSVC